MKTLIAVLVAVLVIGGAGVGYLIWSSGSKSPKIARVSGGGKVSASGKIPSRDYATTPSPRERRKTPRRDYGGSAPGNSDFGKNPESFYEEGEVVVVNPPKNFLEVAGQLGFSVLERVNLDQVGLMIFRMGTPPGKTVPESRALLARRMPGLNMDANHQFQAQQGLKANVRSLIGWTKYPASCGKGIRIGMIDAPVDATHPAFKGQELTYKSFHKESREPGPADHGTAIAAIIAGKPDWGGLLPGAHLFAANMFEKNETGKVVGNGVALLKGLNWLLKNKVRVVNLSVAGADNKAIRTAFKKFAAKGMVLIAAAGNWGPTAKPAFPAAYTQVVAVTAFNDRKLVYSHANNGSYIDFAAPGVQIWTAVPGGGKFQSGTSFASPHVAALMALELAKGARPSPESLKGALKKNMVDLGKGGKDNVFGWGFVHKAPRC